MLFRFSDCVHSTRISCRLQLNLKLIKFMKFSWVANELGHGTVLQIQGFLSKKFYQEYIENTYPKQSIVQFIGQFVNVMLALLEVETC